MKKNKIAKEVLAWTKTLALAFVFAFIVNNTLIASALVVSSSMENTIMTDSRIMGLRTVYVISEPDRFDIILFHPPDSETPIQYVKRIIGLPNEKVEIIDGKVYIDDSDVPLDEPFIKEAAWGNYGPFFVPEDSYFVMGDNRNNSNDSRHWTNKFVPRDNIIARLYIEYFPTPHLLN